MAKADDQGAYFRVPLDARSLQYSVYVDEGDRAYVEAEDYNSNNTKQLDINETAMLISSLPEMQNVAKGFSR